MISETLISRAVSPDLIRGLGSPRDLLSGAGRTEQPGQMDFGAIFRSTIGEVGKLEEQARVAVKGLMSGTGTDVHQALIAAEKANAAFELALAMRNKAVQSYQSVMSMQF